MSMKRTQASRRAARRVGTSGSVRAKAALLLSVTAALVLAGCSAAGRSTNGACPEPRAATNSHLAPELEALLPKQVAGRSLATWSLSGACWVAFAGPGGETLKGEVEALSSGPPIDLEQLAYAVAGRTNVESDPPYFVWAALRPNGDAENALAVALLFGTGGFRGHVSEAADLRNYDRTTIGTKEVFVGSVEMIEQNDHLRGSPYLYQNDDYMFIVVTDDEDWAEEALAHLP